MLRADMHKEIPDHQRNPCPPHMSTGWGIAGEGVPNINFTHAWLAKNGATNVFAAKYASFLAQLEGELETVAEQPLAEKASLA